MLPVLLLATSLGSAAAVRPDVAQAGVLIVKLQEAQAQAPNFSAYAQEVDWIVGRTYRLRVGNVLAATRQLREQASWVETVERDVVLKSQVTPTDPLFLTDQEDLTKQWYLPKMQVHRAWEQTKGEGVTIAVVDTGIDAKHEDLNDGRVVGGFASFCQVQNPAQPNDCVVRVTAELAPGVNSDDNGHGTIVAGIAGAITNNAKGIAGINWNARLMPIKALDATGSGFASDVAAGMRWAADHGAKVINLSIGGQGLQGITVLQEAISYAFNKGVLIVAAAGNDAADTGGSLNTSPVLPVCADGGKNMVVGVAAVDIQDRKARFSNYGSNCVDIAAPGTGTFVDKQQKQGLISTYYDPTRPGEHDLYVYAVGTSVAAPMVSGVASLMISSFPELDIVSLRDRLIGSVDNIDPVNLTGCNGSPCQGQIGRGRLNAFKAVTLATTFSSGTVVRSPEGDLFLIERGLKRPISSYVQKQRFAGAAIVNAAPGQLDNFPLGSPVAPADGSLIKEPANPTVYLVEAGERHGLSYLAFISRGIRCESVVVLPALEMAGYPQTQHDAVLNGVLMKAADHPAVYILNNSVRQLLSFFVFQQRGFQNGPIGTLTPAELAIFPLHPGAVLYPPVDGTLLRGDQVATVYLIEAGKRRGLTLTAFQSRGYRFADVKVLPQSEVDGYELSESILF